MLILAKIKYKGLINIIQISKSESEKIRNEYPDVWISETGRGKPAKRRKRYLPEIERYLRLITDTNIEAAQIVRLKNKRSNRNRNARSGSYERGQTS